MADTPRSERDASRMRVRVSPGPPVILPWRNWQTRLAQDECQLAGSTPAGSTKRLSAESRTRPDGDGSSPQNCDSGFNSSRVLHAGGVCHVGDAEAAEAAVC